MYQIRHDNDKITLLQPWVQGWGPAGSGADGEHLLAAAAANTVLLLDLRRPSLPLLSWRHSAAPHGQPIL